MVITTETSNARDDDFVLCSVDDEAPEVSFVENFEKQRAGGDRCENYVANEESTSSADNESYAGKNKASEEPPEMFKAATNVQERHCKADRPQLLPPFSPIKTKKN